MLKINPNSSMQINIVPAKYKLETKMDHRKTFRTIPIVIEKRNNNRDGSIPKQGFIKPDKLENKPPTGAATLNRQTKKPRKMQRRTSCPDDIYDQIYEDIAVGISYT